VTAVRGDGRVTVSWTRNTGDHDVDGYRVLRNGVPITGQLVAATATYLDIGVTNDVTYSYTVQAHDTSDHWSADSTPAVSATPTDLTPPATPTGVMGGRGEGTAGLAWDPNSEPDLAGYILLRDEAEIATVTDTDFLDSGLTLDRSYSYTLVAVDTHGNRSAPTAPVVITPTDLTAPAGPSGFAAAPGDGRVDLAWSANAEPDVASYRVLRDGVEVAVVTGATSYTDVGLINGVEYRYTLAAIDTHGNHSLSTSPVFVTPVNPGAPAPPTGLTANAGDAEVTLTWAANAEPDIAGYVVRRDGVDVATVTTPGYVDTGLTNGTTYAWTVIAVGTDGDRSLPSSAATATPVSPDAPATPVGVVTTPGDGQVLLSWTANGEPDLATYRVLRNGVEIATVTGTTHTDLSLVNDVTYSYSVVAVDDDGNRSAPSPAVAGRPTDLTPPAAPTGLAAVEGEHAVSLTWTASAEPDLATYRLLRNGVEIATLTSRGFVDTGLTNGVTYTYTLVAVDTHGNRSPASAPVVIVPRDMPPGAPTDVTATPGDRRTVLAWTAPPDADVVEYRVLAEDGAVVATVAAPTTRVALPDLLNGTTYRFTVVAVDAVGGVSVPSDAASVVPASPPLPGLGAGESGGLAVSEDGRFVVVGTRARLEAADTNTAYELYLVDRTAGTAARIAPLPAGATGATDPTNTSAPVISANGGTVALATSAALVAGDTNGRADVYRFDTATRAWSLVSVPSGGGVSATTAGAELQTGSSVYATSPPVALSADGTVALFYSARSDLVAGDTNGVVDLFAKDVTTGAVTRVSTTTAGGNLGGAAMGPALALTPDGRFALFPATSTGGSVQLYRKTLSGPGAGELLHVSTVRSIPFAVFRDAGDIAISDDGRYVALVTAHRITTASPGTSGSAGLAYRLDTVTGAVLALGNGQQTVWEHQVELDPTGRYAFFATASGQLPGDTNGHTDHYRRDLGGGVAGPLLLVTADADGRATAGPIGSVAPAEYGRLIAVTAAEVMVTTSQALVSADTNRIRDLYLKDLVSGLARSPLA
jgi:chitodextrinase